VDTTEDLSIRVNGEVIMFFEVLDEMIGVSLSNYFYSEVVNDEVEGDGTGNVAEESRGVAGWNVASISKVLDEFDIRESSRLWKTVHTGTYFRKYAIVFYKWPKFVLIHYVFWDGPGWNV